MPVIPYSVGSGPSTQVTPIVACPSNQANLGTIIGEVVQWNPDCSVTQIINWANNAYRMIVSRRMWAGLKVWGQIAVPQAYNAGTVSLTLGSNIVTGVGTSFTVEMVGFQFRQGFSTGWYNISEVDSGTQLKLSLPWGNASFTGTGYQILHSIVELGYNIKFILEMLNQRQGYRLFNNIPQKFLNQWDTWRTSQGWTFLSSPREFNPLTGGQFFELYPAPTFQQAFPFLAYVQPPDLKDDTDFVYPYIRTDIIVQLCIANALLFGGPKKNPYYDQFTAEYKTKEAMANLMQMEMEDDCQDPKDLQWDSSFPLSAHGANWLSSHAGSDIEMDY